MSRHRHSKFLSTLKHFTRSWGVLFLFLIWCATTFAFFAKLNRGQDKLSFAAISENEEGNLSEVQKISQLPPAPVMENPKTEPFRPLHLGEKKDAR